MLNHNTFIETDITEPIMFLAGAIFLFTLILVIWQPRGLSIGWSATLGAALALACGVIGLDDIPVVWDIVWNATATFIAVIIISLLLDESGFSNGQPCTFRAGVKGGVDCCSAISYCWAPPWPRSLPTMARR